MNVVIDDTNVVIDKNMKLTIIISIYGITEVESLENLQYLPLLQLHSPFQVVMLDGRIVKLQLTHHKQFKLFTE